MGYLHWLNVYKQNFSQQLITLSYLMQLSEFSISYLY